jgi:predicted 3-demethylubiquinone-9 3-methyltransferase (glyoxalase superfamily)
MEQKITPNLWFDKEAEEAAEFYCSVFDDARILHKQNYPEGAPGPAGEVMIVVWELNGMKFTGINGGPEFKFDEAVSFEIRCSDQDEVDYYWEKLTADGGEESQCGWLKDKYGLAWQVVPEGMEELFNDADSSKAQRAMQAMLKMRKIDLAEIQRAAAGE